MDSQMWRRLVQSGDQGRAFQRDTHAERQHCGLNGPRDATASLEHGGAYSRRSGVPQSARQVMSADRALQMTTSLACRFLRTVTVQMCDFSQP